MDQSRKDFQYSIFNIPRLNKALNILYNEVLLKVSQVAGSTNCPQLLCLSWLINGFTSSDWSPLQSHETALN